MTEAADTLATLARLGSDPMRGVYLQPIADEDAIRRMQVAARRDLGEPVPDGYLALLRLTNGVQINGAYFKAAEHLIPENLDVPRPELIVLGTEGNVAEFVFDGVPGRAARILRVVRGAAGRRPAGAAGAVT